MKVLLLVLILVSCSGSNKYTDLSYYKNGKFLNYQKGPDRGFGDFFKWQFNGKKQKWPERVDLTTLNIGVPDSSIKPIITFIGHSTFLIQVNGLNILTDPVFSERVSPVSWAGPKRVIKAAIVKEKMPKIDFIIVSHNHYDHLDIDSLRFFKKRDNSKIYAGLEVGDVDSDLEIEEMGWWEQRNFNGTEIVFTPCQHFSGRGLFDRNETLWGGFYLKSQLFKVYFAGDTGYSSHFKKFKERFGEVDLAILPIGAYEPRWFMKYVHMNPEEAIKAHQDLNPKLSLGMHWGTFQLTDESRLEPVQKINKLTQELDIKNFQVLEFGESLSL